MEGSVRWKGFVVQVGSRQEWKTKELLMMRVEIQQRKTIWQAYRKEESQKQRLGWVWQREAGSSGQGEACRHERFVMRMTQAVWKEIWRASFTNPFHHTPLISLRIAFKDQGSGRISYANLLPFLAYFVNFPLCVRVAIGPTTYLCKSLSFRIAWRWNQTNGRETTPKRLITSHPRAIRRANCITNQKEKPLCQHRTYVSHS